MIKPPDYCQHKLEAPTNTQGQHNTLQGSIQTAEVKVTIILCKGQYKLQTLQGQYKPRGQGHHKTLQGSIPTTDFTGTIQTPEVKVTTILCKG